MCTAVSEAGGLASNILTSETVIGELSSESRPNTVVRAILTEDNELYWQSAWLVLHWNLRKEGVVDACHSGIAPGPFFGESTARSFSIRGTFKLPLSFGLT